MKSNLSSEETTNFLIEQYINKGKSTYEIAEQLNTYPNKVRRLLVKAGVELRNKSTAQSNAITTGRHKHPTKGTTRSEEDKIKISDGMYNHWSNMTDEEREKRSAQAKKQWESMSLEDREKLRKAAAEAVRRAGKEGSKMEKFLHRELTERGFYVIFHKKGLVPNERLEVDLFLPELKVAIEIDGPSHFFPIWGESNLQKHIRADAHKSGLLLKAGYVVLRVKHLTKSVSKKSQRTVLEAVLGCLATIENKFPPKGKRFIEMEA
jgi:very-short-patch-repair endonuclease|tara:strand:- start:38785 stop:39576 length:792 start_codon:yes stop_codon:yes gene_type:complete